MTHNNLIDIVFEIVSELNIPAVIIDIHISIFFRTQDELDNFIKKLNDYGFETKQLPRIEHDLFTIFGHSSEAEIWLKPCDAFEWDEEMASRRMRFFKKIYVLSKEDYILTKFLRMDRSSIDLQDIIQIIVNNYESINWNYLIFRLKSYNAFNQFDEIIEKIKKENPMIIPEQIIRLFSS
jgi:hypothetical protein